MARKTSPPERGKKTPAKTSAPEARSGREPGDPQPPSFPVVAVGASAGGLEAFRELFAALPATTGMAFVLIQHLDPRHKSLLPEILRRTSTMPVTEVTDGMRVEPNHVFVMPPNVRMTISDRILGLVPRETERHHLPIDRFFFSLAADQKSRAIGIVLSGTDEDGTEGSRAIKAAGGMTFAQDEESAQFETMPRSAVEKGSVDLVLPPAKIAAELMRLAAHPLHPPINARDLATATERPGLEIKKEDLEEILAMMRKSFKADFSQYKLPTLRRRVLRRMAMQKRETVEEYRDYLEAHGDEIELLYRDILIGVTSFFRDSERFKILKSAVFPEILKRRAPDDPIRVWVPACSTGEEAYSMAIALTEFLGENASRTAVQVFATDINEKSLEKGRAGLYGEHVAENVSAERLGNFFVKSSGGYTISKRIRELVIFAPQDLIKDPPFSKIDLLSCCNLLIYLEPELHKRVIPLLHYSLRPSGFLMLGTSEGIGPFTDHFEVIDNKYKIYRKNWSSARPIITTPPERESAPRIAARPIAAGDPQKEASRLLLARFAPAGAIVDEGLEIIQFHGDAGPFLSPAAGAVSFNLFKMVREELLNDLRAAVQKAKKQLVPIRKEHIRFSERNQSRLVNLEVVPYRAGERRYFLVLFEESQPRTKAEPKRERASKSSPGASRKTVQLTQELEAMKDYVRSIMEEHERIESDVHAASEELQSSNEELQSTNEELETAKEEVQSANEELTTLNEELGNQNRELIQLGDDMSNLLGSVDIAIVIVDGDLRIRRLNKTAEKKLNLITTDVGRPITDLRLPVDLPDVEPLIREVMSTLTMTEHQVQDTEGRWHSLRIRPYRTIRNVIDGVVMTLVDIEDLRRSLGDEKEARERAEAAETRWSLLAEASLLLSSIDYETTLKAVAELATPRFAEWVTVDIAEEDGAIRHLAISHAIPAKTDLVTQLRDLSGAGDETSFGSRMVLQTGQAEFLPVVGEDVASLSKRDPRWFRLARALDVRSLICVPLTARGKTLGSITFAASGKMRPYEHADFRLAQELGRRAGLAIDNAQLFKAAGDANRFKDDFLATLSHELRTPMTAVLGWTQLLQLGQLDEETQRRAVDTIEISTKIQLHLIEDLLDISRVTTGKMRLELVAQPLRPVLEAALETVRPAAEAKRIRIERRFDAVDAVVAGDPIRLEQVFWNLLINAVKFTPPESEVVIELDKEDSFARIRVRDTGEGIAPNFLPHVFERFRQDDRVGRDLRKGLGLGLAIARQLVEMHGGTIEAASPGTGQGSTFTVKLPLVG